MRKINAAVVAFVAGAFVATLARADSVYIDGLKNSATVVGMKGGKLAITLNGIDRSYDLESIGEVTLDNVPKFAEAETARTSDAKAAAAMYKLIIPTLNKPELKQFAQWRAIAPTDADGRWAEAVQLFLDVYVANPTEGVWKGRPTHMPKAGSTMLPESVEKVNVAIKGAKNEEARKNLKLFLLDIYTQAGDTQSAQRLAKEISTGIAEEVPAPKAADNALPASGLAASGNPALVEIENAIRGKNYDAAVRQADSLLASSTGEAAVQLFSLKAQAFEAQDKLDEALAAWLRIPAHHPESPAAPGALLHAADLDKRLKRADAAKALYHEIAEKYPTSKEAETAKREQ